MKRSAILRFLLVVTLLLWGLSAGCRSLERTVERISDHTQNSVDRVTMSIRRTETKIFDSFPDDD